MENNKYYPPDLEEFHLGFRYEGRYANINFDEGKCTVGKWSDWTPTQYGNLDCNLYTEQRVKYLDREDIEELGWVYDKGYRQYYIESKEKRFSLYLTEITAELIITMLHTKVTNFGQVIFIGRIKNYNELKTLMKQIGII